MIKLYNNELSFLIYYVPLFFLKLLNITASNFALQIAAVTCFVLFFIFKKNININKYTGLFLLCFCAFTIVLTFTCGKQGAFFSVFTILALNFIEMDRKVYKILFWVSVIGVLTSMYLVREGIETLRFINGEWVEIYKRSNILYISFLACINLYFYKGKKKQATLTEVLIISILGYLMYQYTGCRSGYVVLCVLCMTLLLLKIRYIYNNVIWRKMCILSPFIFLISTYLASYFYDQIYGFVYLDKILQGRVSLGYQYINTYNMNLFGQHIFKSTDIYDYSILDSAYLDMLISYGVIFTIVWIFTTCKSIEYYYNKKEFVKVASIISYAIYGVSETFLSNCFLNVSILLYAKWFYSTNASHCTMLKIFKSSQ